MGENEELRKIPENLDRNKHAEWYIRIYQQSGRAALSSIPDNDTSLSLRAQEQLARANYHAVQMMDSLANVITLINDPEASEDKLL